MKIIVTVHGIGDQVRNETALSTVVRFCDHFGYPGMVPLGALYGTLEHKLPALVLTDPPVRAGLTGEMGFAEVHWADIARRISNEGYTLQETKAWARSVVNRVRVMAARKNPDDPAIDYRRIRMVLEEIIEAITVIEALLFLARKTGLFDFNLKAVLDSFLGDVQLMADFNPIRAEVVGRFHQVLQAVEATYPTAEIHVVTHSEGTVVSWLALLEAADDPARHPWISRVRGFMTIGSPIDKHLILWPGLFEKFHRPTFLPAAGQPRIRWVNYADYGDPVGFELDTAWDWLERTGYNRVFAFDKADDFAFSRYYLPGKAHVDYWNDSEVFGHFIRKVVTPSPAPTEPEQKKLAKGPPNLLGPRLVSYVAGYLLPLLIIFLGVYILYKNVGDFLHPNAAQTQEYLLPNVLALGGLLAGTTVWLRLTRLTKGAFWFFTGAAVYAISAFIFWLVDPAVRAVQTGELAWLETLPHKLSPGLGVLFGSAALVGIILIVNLRGWRSWLKLGPPQHEGLSGLKQMIWLTGATLLATAILQARLPQEHGSLWPVLIAIAAFLYLWWLATLLFDLVFVWHRYIRHAGVLKFLRAKLKP